MKKNTVSLFSLLLLAASATAQISPAISSWMQNTIGTGTYYTNGSSILIENDILYNCQKVEYSATSVYVTATGVPSYPTGPFNDGNPSNATNQNGIYKFPLNPVANTGAESVTTGGNIGLFINGVALFDYRDGVAWNATTQTLCGGPGNPPCPGGMAATQDWNRDAIPAEKAGFDCAKGHPAMGNYHHHQNPSAFKLDKTVISDICNLYDADGLYVIDAEVHSPLLGFAYDGFPIYGAYGYAKKDGTGGISRMKSGYTLRNITTRTTKPDGSPSVTGPAVSATYFLGYFREDYVFAANTDESYLDKHNGRFCVTPEYPNGTYAYFCTVDENWNSTYPYAVGTTFYGTRADRKVTSITETTTVYNTTTSSVNYLNGLDINIFPNPATDLIAIQIGSLVTEDVTVELLDVTGKLIKSTQISKGQTVAYFDVQTVYEGTYFVKLSNGMSSTSNIIVITR